MCDIGASFTHIAEALRDDFAQVLYWTPWDAGFASAVKFLPGIGVPGLERIADFYDELDRIDLFVWPDVGYGGVQEDLRARGWPVFGSGAGGRFERDRLFLKKTCAAVGVESAEYMVIEGLDNLRTLLSKDFEAYVKTSFFRADGETFKHEKAVATRSRLDEMGLQMGPYASLAQFIVEVPIGDNEGPCVEVGIDSFCTEGRFPRRQMWGYEIKDTSAIATTAAVPVRLRTVQQRIGDALTGVGYRGAFSTETREDRTGSYMLDATCRFGSPLSELQTRLITNLGEIIEGVANGQVVEPEFAARFGAQIIMRSEWFRYHPLAVCFEHPERVVLHGHCIVDGQDYAVCGTEPVPVPIIEFGAVIGLGDTLTAAIEEAFAVAEEISGRDVQYDSGALEKAVETIKNGAKLGLNFTSLKEYDDAA